MSVIMTAAGAAAVPMMTKRQVDSLKAELVKLTQQRKDMKRFLDIDKEKAEHERLLKRNKACVEKANDTALAVVAKAKTEADQIRQQAMADRELARKYSARLSREASKKTEEAERRLESANRRIQDAVAAEAGLTSGAMDLKENKAKLKLKMTSLIRLMEGMEL